MSCDCHICKVAKCIQQAVEFNKSGNVHGEANRIEAAIGELQAYRRELRAKELKVREGLSPRLH